MNEKIKALLLMKSKTLTKYAKFTGRSQSNISNKVSRCSWNVKDFIEMAEFTGTQLAFVDENDKVVIRFDLNDIKEENK